MFTKQIRVLLVEDNPADVRLVQEMLREAERLEFVVKHVASAQGCIEALLDSKGTDVILLDLGLTDERGLDTLRKLEPAANGAAIVVLTGLQDEETALAALREGAQDYLYKEDLESRLLRRVIKYAIERQALIKERDESMRSLDSANARMRRFVEANIVGVVICDAGGRILEANDYFLRLIDYTRTEFDEGRIDWRAITPAEWSAADDDAFAELRATGTSAPYEMEYSRRDASRVSALITDALLPGDEGYIARLVVDITDRKRAEAALSRLNQELEQRVMQRTVQLAASNRDLESFSYSVSHDLRAPLRAIDSFSKFIVDDYADKLDEEGRRLLGILRTNAQKMGQLIDDVLAFSRAGTHELQVSTVNMTELFLSVFDELKARQPNRRLEMQIVDLPMVNADSRALRQVVTNLLGNSAKFTRGREVPQIRVEGSANESEVTYSISDNGVGFDPKYQSKLFTMFERLHPPEEFEGTGVGLAIVKRVVDKLGGRVWAQSQPGQGATFSFSISQVGVSVPGGKPK